MGLRAGRVPGARGIRAEGLQNIVWKDWWKMDQAIYEVKDIMRIMRISRNTAYKLIKQGGIPHIHIGGHYKIPAERFHQWLNSQFAHLHNNSVCDTIDA